VNLRFRTLKTTQGYVGFVASGRGLRRVYLPQRTSDKLKHTIRKETPGVTEDPRLLPQLAAGLQRYFAGRSVNFNVKLDWTDRSEFDADSPTAEPARTSSSPNKSAAPARPVPSATP
jgi:hypothetical protein